MATSENWYNRRKGKHAGDIFKLDTKNKTPEENVVEIIQGLYVRNTYQSEVSPTSNHATLPDTRLPLGSRSLPRNSTDNRRLSYLNALVTLLCKEDRNRLGFTTEELMCCIRISLVDEQINIRAAALRVLRYLIKTENDVIIFNTLRLPYLVVRCMDLIRRNEEERAQALRVVRRVVAVVGGGARVRRPRAAHVEPGLLRCLAAVARVGSAGEGSGDRLARPAIATLAEIGVLNAPLFTACGGVGAVTRFLQECATPRMAEALCGVLLHTLDAPAARRSARVDLRCLCSPYCDFHYRLGSSDKNRDEREMQRFTCSRLALLCVLRSWPGLLHFCHPLSESGLRSLVHALHLERLEVRKAILDLLYELLGLPQPEWTDEISVALDAVDPSDFQDSWRLNDGFVAEEGCDILPHLSATGPDITEIHLSLLLYCFLEAGLLDGLAEVIVTSDTFISVRATVLLGQLLHLIHLLLPPEICSITPALPSLLSQASAGKPQALAAIAALQRLHAMLEARPATSSLFLDHIIQYCSGAFEESPPESKKDSNVTSKSKNDTLSNQDSLEFLNDSDGELEITQRHSLGSRSEYRSRNESALVKSKSVSSRTSAAVSKVAKTSKLFNLFERESDSLIRSSLVMQNMDGMTWNWEVIRTILKERDGSPLLNLGDSRHREWTGRIIDYLKPSSNKYSHGEVSAAHSHSATRAGCQLVRLLLRHGDADVHRLIESLFLDVREQVVAIKTGQKAHDCLFSPQHMSTTMCQMYFLFVGQLCHSRAGLKLFYESGLYDSLLELSTKTHHSCYVKLVISSLDYTLDSYPRDILAKTLTCGIEASRLYATQFLNVLLRASQKSEEIMRKKLKIPKQRNRDHIRSPYNGNMGPRMGTGLDMDSWILDMLVKQIKDESKDVVKSALTILEEACNVPCYLDGLVWMRETVRQNCQLSREPVSDIAGVAGDRGYLLWLRLEVAAAGGACDAPTTALLSTHLHFWTHSYNYRYVRLVDSSTHEALTLGGEAGGAGSRRGRRAARPPPHLHAALAQHAAGRELLATVLPHHHRTIKQARCGSEQEIMDLKSSLWALGNAATSAQGVEMLLRLSGGVLEDSAFVAIVRLARYCQVYSVRAAAFYVLGLIGCTYDGASLLYDLGWLCVRHTRHDRFPIIHEENWSNSSHAELQRHLTSRLLDTEPSELSDHTDQSTDQSLHSDQTKHSMLAAVTIERSDESCDTVDYKSPLLKLDGRSIMDRPEKRLKSQTLPQRSPYPALHERGSLSESKTVDILRDVSIYDRSVPLHIGPTSENRLLVGRINSLDQSQEGRMRNTSESSTSGVSSCDSVLGKYIFQDRIARLSPIPSSSSLYGMKGSAPRVKMADVHRRTSMTNFTAPDASSPPSQQDMVGYATLKSLNKHRRPHLSESAAAGASELEELSWALGQGRRTKPFSSLRDRSRATEERVAKRSLLKYDWKPISTVDSSSQKQLSSVPPLPSKRSESPAPAAPPHCDGPCYVGICLPKNLIDIFPREDADETLVDSLVGDTSFMLDASVSVAETKTLTSPDNHSFVSSRGSGTGGGGDAGWGAWRHAASGCLACARTRPPSAHELREAFFADLESPKTSCSAGGRESVTSSVASGPPSPASTLSQDALPPVQLLHHAQLMANPLHHKQTKPALLSLKQRHPEAFQSVCVYSEVSALLGTTTYMMSARRFLQELFVDTTFECFSSEPQQILARRPPPLPLNVRTT